MWRCRLYDTDAMIEVLETSEYRKWLLGLHDQIARAKIIKRVNRLALGNVGDVKPVGDGLSELRIHHGPGYRVYFRMIGGELVLLLCGGDKGSQGRDIARAKRLAAELRGSRP